MSGTEAVQHPATDAWWEKVTVAHADTPETLNHLQDARANMAYLEGVAHDLRAKLQAAERDALRWQTLFEMPRIRLLGYARGGPEGRDGPIQHIGFEFTTYPAKWDGAASEKETGRATLLEFIDAQLPKEAK